MGNGIAFNASVNGGSVTGTSLTFAHRCAYSVEGILWVAAYRVENPITGATYAGVAMTEAATVTETVAGRFMHLFMLVNPAAGTNNVVVSTSGSSFIQALCASYSGARTTSQPDNTTTNNDTTSADHLTTALTPVSDNSWMLMVAKSDQSYIGATNCIERQATDNFSIFDTNGPVTPPVSTSLTFTMTFFTTQHAAIVASFAPNVATSVGRGRSRRQRAGWSVSSPGGFF